MNFDAIQTQNDNERAAAQSIHEMSKPFIERAANDMQATTIRLFGNTPTDWIIERFDLAGLEFWGGPNRAVFSSKTAEECFDWLLDSVQKFPEGKAGINPLAVRQKVSSVVKEQGKRGQLFLYWMWKG